MSEWGMSLPVEQVGEGRRATRAGLESEVDRVVGKVRQYAEDLLVASAWYQSVGDGLAATTSGQTFLVFEDVGGVLEIWQNLSGEGVFVGSIAGAPDLEAAVQAASSAAEASELARDESEAARDAAVSAAATAAGDTLAARNALPILVTAGTAPAYEVTPVDAIAELAAGMAFRLAIHAENSGPATLAVGGLSAVAIEARDSSGAAVALEAGDLRAGDVVTVVHDGTRFILARLRPATLAEAEASEGRGVVLAEQLGPAIAALAPPSSALHPFEVLEPGTQVRSRIDAEANRATGGWATRHSWAFLQAGTIRVTGEVRSTDSFTPEEGGGTTYACTSGLRVVRIRDGVTTEIEVFTIVSPNTAWPGGTSSWLPVSRDVDVVPGDEVLIQWGIVNNGGGSSLGTASIRNARFQTAGQNLWPGAGARLEGNDYGLS